MAEYKGINADCPTDELPDGASFNRTCVKTVGSYIRFFLMKLGGDEGLLTANIGTEATWTAMTAASGVDKLYTSPKMFDDTFAPGEVSQDVSSSGELAINGYDQSTVVMMLDNPSEAEERSIRSFINGDAKNFKVAFVTSFSEVVVYSDDETPTEAISFLPCKAIYVPASMKENRSGGNSFSKLSITFTFDDIVWGNRKSYGSYAFLQTLSA